MAAARPGRVVALAGSRRWGRCVLMGEGGRLVTHHYPPVGASAAYAMADKGTGGKVAIEFGR